MATTNIYILCLEGGRYYVGKTNDIQARYQQHLTGNGSAWTKKYKPLSIEKTIENVSSFEEDKFTKEYMSKYGIDKVRGGSYTSIDLSEEQEETLCLELRAANDKCLKCGKSGHFANQCKRRSSFTALCECGKKYMDVNEFMTHQKICLPRSAKYREEYSEDEEEEWECEYCDRTFTTEFGCSVHERSCKNKNTTTEVICYRCGNKGHYSSNCYASRHVKGYYLN